MVLDASPEILGRTLDCFSPSEIGESVRDDTEISPPAHLRRRGGRRSEWIRVQNEWGRSPRCLAARQRGAVRGIVRAHSQRGSDTNGGKRFFDPQALLPPEIIAAPIMWLASDASDNLTGHRINAARWNSALAARAACSGPSPANALTVPYFYTDTKVFCRTVDSKVFPYTYAIRWTHDRTLSRGCETEWAFAS